MKQILVIEDDQFVRETTVDMLEAEGYRLISAENGLKGVQLATERQPDLIVCDIMMPKLDGYGVLAALQQKPATSTIPFIFVTARAGKSDLRLGMQLGADDYLVKPFTMGELLSAIEARLQHHAALAEYYNQQLEETEVKLLTFIEADILQNLQPVAAALEAPVVALYLPRDSHPASRNLKLFRHYPAHLPAGIFSRKLANQAFQTGHLGFYQLDNGYTVAYLPLVWKDELLGILGLARPLDQAIPGEPEILDHAYQRRLLIVRYHLALALNNARLAAQTLKQRQEKETTDLSSSLLSAVSHELRTPLTSIKSALSGLKDSVIDLSPEEQQDYVGLIDQEVDRLEKLIGQMLDQNRIEAGQLKTEKGLFFLPEIVNSTIDRLNRLPLLAGHPIETEFENNLPLVGIDFIQLEQVLTNLLENAAKYSEAAAPITVRVYRSNRPFQAVPAPTQLGVRVEVVDQGAGLPEADLDRIFTKYYRVHLTTGGHTRIPGLGLGLAIARSLITAHGGEIWAYPNPEKGSTFAFWLPF